MSPTRPLPLFDPRARPQSWNERMLPGEYATLYSSLQVGSDSNRPLEDGPFCAVFSSLAEAAASMIIMGWAGSRSGKFVARNTRRRTACLAGFGEVGVTVCLAGGVVLTVVDWRADFGMLWPAMFGTRMIPAGLFLLGTDLIINMEAKRKRRRGALKVP